MRGHHAVESFRNQRTHQEQDRQPRHRHDGAHGRDRCLDLRRHCARPRALRRDGGRDARVSGQRVRPCSEPRARLGRRRDSRRIRAHLRGRHCQVHGPHPVGAGRTGADRTRGEFAWPADRRQGSGHGQGIGRHREDRAGRDLAQIGVAAGADGPESDRRDGADRPRPARAHHRRPPDGQDRRGDRHDHQPEGQGSHLHLRRDRAEGLVGQERDPQA